MFVEYITVVPVEGIEQYVLSNPSEVVHFFVPPRGSCQLPEQVYQVNSNAKSIVRVCSV